MCKARYLITLKKSKENFYYIVEMADLFIHVSMKKIQFPLYFCSFMDCIIYINENLRIVKSNIAFT